MPFEQLNKALPDHAGGAQNTDGNFLICHDGLGWIVTSGAARVEPWIALVASTEEDVAAIGKRI
jgi:hypothetical protein